ncbi:MAG: Hsp20/alpha crystallin family protein [Thermodesulfobacteriota bacterium]
MTIVRFWDPMKELSAMQNRMNRIFGETFGPSMTQAEPPLAGTWSPSVDIYETDQEIVLKVELPGVPKEQVHVEVDDGTLHLKGERKIEKEVKEENYHRVERVYGPFHRSFSLPDTVDPEKVRAELKDGVLELRLGKREQAKPRQIQVGVN